MEKERSDEKAGTASGKTAKRGIVEALTILGTNLLARPGKNMCEKGVWGF